MEVCAALPVDESLIMRSFIASLHMKLLQLKDVVAPPTLSFLLPSLSSLFCPAIGAFVVAINALSPVGAPVRHIKAHFLLSLNMPPLLPSQLTLL